MAYQFLNFCLSHVGQSQGSHAANYKDEGTGWRLISTRVTFQSLNYTFLHDLVEDARTIMQEIGERRAFEADEPLY